MATQTSFSELHHPGVEFMKKRNDKRNALAILNRVLRNAQFPAEFLIALPKTMIKVTVGQR